MPSARSAGPNKKRSPAGKARTGGKAAARSKKPVSRKKTATGADQAELAGLRKKIDALDAELVRMVNERAEVASAIGHWKVKQGVKAYAPSREQ